ncbi:hypothetical protein FGO68_gene7167 [Halteria grandinella]|uniref:Protein kinase domain-containing protein n=1 Tax=Halteria grandinella TaxID=5974 RepID=A0A8J8T487_HALGN|nr:hypothetical protein FGO68_gene7167 [Halteria grandinella]
MKKANSEVYKRRGNIFIYNIKYIKFARVLYQRKNKYFMDPLPADVKGYRFLKRIGEGTFAITYQVEHVETRERFAMKVPKDMLTLKGRGDCRQEILNEIEFLENADHPFIIRFKESFRLSPDDPAARECIVLEHADGCDLCTKMLALNRPVPERLALIWFTEACLGIARMHELHNAHRDIKPGNILLVGDRSGGIATIADFGSVKKIDFFDKQTPFVGTPQYYAPEKLNGNYDEKIDVWSLGIVLYEMLTFGDHPIEYEFEGAHVLDYMAKFPKLKFKQMPTHISKECQTLISRLLTKDPVQRPSIFDVLKMPIIYNQILQITDGFILGFDISQKITRQMLDLDIHGPVALSDEEEKKESIPPTAATSISAALSSLQIKPSSCFFKQEMLDRLIDTFNKPINNYKPQLNANGQSLMAECILSKWGWKWSLHQLNQRAKTEAQWAVFEGKKRGEWLGDLEQGVYYGEMLNGNRHGYGIVYTTKGDDVAYLFECQWDKGTPIEGRYIWIWSYNNHWFKCEGTFNHRYELHGQGKRIWSEGSSYEGGWKDGNQHGQGRNTFMEGGYQEGEWEKNKAIGVHRYYNKQGHLLKIFDEDKWKELTEEEYQKMQK